jgi:RNA polymerase sigma-70 factor (ECF subfamily)
MANFDLKTVVSDARIGDADAWEQIYLHLYPRLSSYARGHLDADRASEAVSETFARAVAGIHRFFWKDSGFEGWVFAILRNVIVDMHRKSGRAQRAPLVFDGDRIQIEPIDRLLADEESDAIRKAFSRLAPSDQEILHLRVVSGLSSDEVATTLGKRPGAIRMAQARALDRLRNELDMDSAP